MGEGDFEKSMRPGHLLRQPVGKVRARNSWVVKSRNDGFPAVQLNVTAGRPSLLVLYDVNAAAGYGR